MPLNINLLQILLHMFNFVILAGGLTFLLFKPVNKFLDERREHFEKAAKKNAEQSAENERMKAEYEAQLAEAKVQITQMRADAEKEIADTTRAYLAETKEKAHAIIIAAEQEAEDRKEHILDAAQTEIGELVVSAAQKLLSDTVTPERNSALYDEFIRLADKVVADKRSS